MRLFRICVATEVQNFIGGQYVDACCRILFILGKHEPVINIITAGEGEGEGEEVPAGITDASHAALTGYFPPFCMYSFNLRTLDC